MKTAFAALVAAVYLLLAGAVAAPAAAEATEIASFSTYFHLTAQNRSANIALAASFLDGATIEGGSYLSFNEKVGKRTAARGFKTAHIIVDGKFVDGVGGGVCQVSTTLYNAALRAGLRTHSQSHSLPVSYVAKGFDAMVSSQNDLIIYNDCDAPYFLRCTVVQNKLTVSIWGHCQKPNLAFWSKTIETYPATEYEIIYVPERAEDGTAIERIVKEGNCGAAIDSYVTVTEDGAQRVEKLRTSYYKATKGIKEVSAPES